MNERDFLTLAVTLAGGPTEAEARTALSRAYYAAFHVARRLLAELGFTVPRADRAHAYLALRLQNCGALPVQQAGADLDMLRKLRNQADYDLHLFLGPPLARVQVRGADQIIRVLDAARAEPTRTQITDGMRVYERDVLHDVTWHHP
jgi:uncharacterized protein (UPF0332 family)